MRSLKKLVSIRSKQHIRMIAGGEE